MQKIAVLASGGLESAFLLRWALKQGKNVYPIYVESGHIWEKAEKAHLKRLLRAIKTRKLKPLTTLSIPTADIDNHIWSITGRRVPDAKSKDQAVYLPGKNILLIAKAAVYSLQRKIHEIALGVLGTNPFSDASSKFFHLYEATLSKGLGSKIKIRAPFLLKTKKDVMKTGRGLPLELTFSCIRPIKNFHCGKCNKCAERKKAFKSAGIQDLTEYAN